MNPVSPKVTVAAVAGAVTVILTYIAGLLGLEVPAEVASAVTLLLMGGAAYVKRDPMREDYIADHAAE